MADAIAKGYNIRLIECLTGFKYIGQQILGFETSGKGTYLFDLKKATASGSEPMPGIKMAIRGDDGSLRGCRIL